MKLRNLVFLWVFTTILVTSAVVLFAINRLVTSQIESLASDNMQRSTESVAAVLGPYLWAGDMDAATQRATLIAESMPFVDGFQLKHVDAALPVTAHGTTTRLLAAAPVMFEGVEQGTLTVYFNKRIDDLSPAIDPVGFSASIAAVVFLGLLVGAILLRPILTGIGKLRSAARQLERGDLETTIVASGLDEVSNVLRALEDSRQQLRRASILKDRFMAGMNHELRTPLGHVVLGLEAMKEAEELPAAHRALCERMIGQVMFCRQLMDDYLALGAVIDREFKPTIEETHISSAINAVVLSAETQAKQKRLQFTVASTVASAILDRFVFVTIVSNLVGNAIKYTNSGHVSLRIDWADATHIRIIVSDSGQGISKDDLKTIFDAYRQLYGGHSGVGLGLNLVKQAVTAAGGAISVDSELGVGTTFEVTLPAARAEAPANSPKDADDERTTLPLPNHILIADDEVDGRTLMAQVLGRQSGISIYQARDGHEALEYAMIDCPDLMILDIRMPKMSGIEVAQQLRANRISVPIVAVTGDTQPSTIQACLDAGFSAVVRRPYTPSELLGAVQEALHRSSAKPDNVTGDAA